MPLAYFYGRTILGLPGKVAKGNTQRVRRNPGSFFTLADVHRTYADSVTILGLPGKIGNANTRSPTKVFFWQRTMERRIRDTKRRLMGYEAAGDTERYQRTAALLQKQNAAYDAYCKENGLTKQTDRISIAKWNRSEAAKARVAAKKWKEYQTTRKYRKKSNQNGFFTMDNRAGSMDIIKPKNIINEMKKSYIGRTLYDFMQSNGIDVMLWYGVDAPSGRMGVFEDGIIHIYAENTKTILETALTVIHEATHAKINSPNSKNQEFECFKNEKIHQGIELTESVLQDIIKQIDELYPYLDWE